MFKSAETLQFILSFICAIVLFSSFLCEDEFVLFRTFSMSWWLGNIRCQCQGFILMQSYAKTSDPNQSQIITELHANSYTHKHLNTFRVRLIDWLAYPRFLVILKTFSCSIIYSSTTCTHSHSLFLSILPFHSKPFFFTQEKAIFTFPCVVPPFQ